MTTFDDWVNAHTNRNTNVDGAYGAQCWDLWAAYACDLCGADMADVHTPGSGQYAGLAGGVYADFPRTEHLASLFDRVPAGQPARKGDAAFWGYDAGHPSSHVAIVIEDQTDQSGIRVIAQNVDATQAARIMWETPATLGYLRPKNNEGGTMAITDDDIMRIWTHVLPNGSCVRDCLSPAIKDIYNMHDTGLNAGQWLHVLPNGRVARDIISDATSDVIRMHDMMIPQLTAQVTALAAAVDALSQAMGADPDQIAQAVEDAVKAKLDQLDITVSVADGKA